MPLAIVLLARSRFGTASRSRRDDLIEFALEHEALTTRELAVKYTDEKRYFVSESSAYRFLKAADLITAPELCRDQSRR